MSAKIVLISWWLVCAKASSSRSSHYPVGPRQANGAVAENVFLRRAYHSSAVLNGSVYIDGGEFSYSSRRNVHYQYSNTLLSIGLSKDWTNDTVVLHSTPKPDGVPSLRNGGIWIDEVKGILYTGFCGTESKFGDKAVYPQGLWSFTPNGSRGGPWRNLNKTADLGFVSLPRPYKGQTASVHSFGFYLEGFIGNETGEQIPLSSLSSYDLSSNKLTNKAVVGASTQGLEQYGGMVYVPNFVNQGILINVGGDQDGRVDADDLIFFRKVQVYDPESQRWFEQKTTGYSLQSRIEFCIAGIAFNNHTYEILIYAGYDGQLGSSAVPYDSAFVLTLPGFFWVKADYPPARPRHGLSCNAVGGSQVLVIGGVDTSQQDDPDDKTEYESVFNTTDPFTQGLAIFDLHYLTWNSSFTAKPTSYAPAPQVQDYYNTKGRKPESGFVSPALETLFSVQNFNDTDTTTSSSSSTVNYNRMSNAGAIAGGVVGVVFGFACIFSLVVCFRRRRKRETEARKPVVRLLSPPNDLVLPLSTRGIGVLGANTTSIVSHEKPLASRRQELSAAAADNHHHHHPAQRPVSELPLSRKLPPKKNGTGR